MYTTSTQRMRTTIEYARPNAFTHNMGHVGASRTKTIRHTRTKTVWLSIRMFTKKTKPASVQGVKNRL